MFVAVDEDVNKKSQSHRIMLNHHMINQMVGFSQLKGELPCHAILRIRYFLNENFGLPWTMEATSL